MTDIVERAADLIGRWYTDHGEHHKIAEALAAAGLLKTPEQQAVLDAAEAWNDVPYGKDAVERHDLGDAVDALRASQTTQESTPS